jgi:uncharacterized repeat protein (TIGR01451 family)
MCRFFSQWCSGLLPILMALVLSGVCGPLAALAEPAAAGLVIRNTAEATYLNTRLGVMETVRSNTVSATVLPVPAYELTGKGELVLARGGASIHQYEAVNVGNVDLMMEFTTLDEDSAGAVTDSTLWYDSNRNGFVDDDDVRIEPGMEMSLPMGQAMSILQAITVSPDAAPGDVVLSRLMTKAWTEGLSMPVSAYGSAGGRVRVVEATLDLDKTFSHRETPKGTLITFALRLFNNSTSPVAAYDAVEGAPIMIDGAAARGVLVDDPVPLNTRLVSAETTRSLTTLYHLADTPARHYVTQPPADPAEVDAVAFFHDGDYPVGQFRELTFTVLRPAALGAAEVVNTAETFVGGVSVPVKMASNRVRIPGQGAAGVTLDFTDPVSGAPASHAVPGADTTLRAVSGACNVTHGVDKVLIEVRSRLTGDVEYVTGFETGANTGIFTSAPLPIAEMAAPVSGDGVMASGNGDTLGGRVICGGLPAEAELMISPGFFAFDSVTNAAVADAEIALYDPSGTMIASAMTGPDGFAALGEAPAGDYRLMVRPPSEFSFPSVRSGFAGYGRLVKDTASYGLDFRHAGGPLALIDIPLDPFYGVPLTLEKTANKERVQVGEFVLYTLTATNNMNQALMRGEISDLLPRNAVLVAGTVRLDGAPIADPRVAAGGALVFGVGDLPPLGSVTLEYVLRFTPTTEAGERINEAMFRGFQAGTGQVRVSNIARARVRLNSGGVFSREATVIGTVFLDCNRNGVMDGADELGVPGVRIVTQQGLAVVTDRDGKYSLFGLKPISHVLALQASTLPVHARPRVSRVADMGQAGSRLVALKRGELRSEMFPLEGCSPEAFAEVRARAETLKDRAAGDGNLLGDLPIETAGADTRSVRSEAGLATTTQVYGDATGDEAGPEGPEGPGAPESANAAGPAPAGPLKTVLKELGAGFGFVGIADGAQVTRRSLKLRVKGPADLTLTLTLNGQEVGNDRVGEHATWEGGNLQAKEYIALRLNPGPNRLQLTGTDGFGITRKTAEITVTAPGDPARVEIVAPPEVQASPGSAVPVVVRLLDGRGNPVRASAVVTLEARNARWDVTDIREDQPGVQAFIDNGEASFDLLAPQSTGPERIGVRSGFGNDSARILFKPALEDRILVGIIEGSVGLRNGEVHIDGDSLGPFEDTVSGLRGEVYLKGRIRGDALLTLRYSSDRDTEDRLFRDIRADEYYPVYGDDSERGFDAQSSTNLFVKVEKGGSYILYGDIAVEPEDPAFRLGGYRDVTTGVKAHWEDERTRLTVFAARTAQQSRTVEFRGRGVAGPYDIDLARFREGSDQVEILVRDADTGEVLSTRQLRRMLDYTLDYFRNTIVFDYPIAQADRDGNPVFVRVTYQVEGGSRDTYWLYGGEGVLELGERTRAGLRVIRSDGAAGSDERFGIDAGFVEHQLGENAKVLVEIARSETGAGEEGAAARIAYEYASATARFQLEAAIASEDFAPPAAPVRPGTEQLRLSFEKKLSDSSSLSANAEYLRDRIGDAERVSVDLNLRRVLSEHVIRTDGLRWSRDLRRSFDEGSDLLWVQSAEWHLESTPGLTLDYDLETPFLGVDQGVLRVGGEYKREDGLVYFGEVEFSFGPLGDRLTWASLGTEYEVNDWLTGRSEVEQAADDAAALRQAFDGYWELNERLSLRAGVEHTFQLGVPDSGLTSLTLGAKWASEDGGWIGEASLDQTFEAQGYTAYVDLGLAGAVNPDLTLLARSRYAHDGRGNGPDRHRHRLRGGLAYRPKTEARLNVLAWYENRLEMHDTRSVDHLWSVAGTWDANPRLRLNGRYAGQWSGQDFWNGAEVEGLLHLAQGGVTGELIRNSLEASLNAYHMWDDSGFSSQALGVEAGFVVSEGMMLSVGYNHSAETRPYDTPFYEDGLYLKLRLKFDDSLWETLDRFGAN